MTQTRQILIVDDDQDLRQALGEQLALHPEFAVAQAPNVAFLVAARFFQGIGGALMLPVGRLVLMVCGYRDEERALLSDKICTALQLANFWQDAVRDSVTRILVSPRFLFLAPSS